MSFFSMPGWPADRRRTKQQYVLTVALLTFLSFAAFAYLYGYAKSAVVTTERSWLDIVICGGSILVGSALQKHYFPIEGTAQAQLPWSFEFHSSTLTGILANIISMLAKLYCVETLGAERAIAYLLPAEGLYRAHRGGFMRTDRLTVSIVSLAVVAGFVSDYLSRVATDAITIGSLTSGYIAIVAALCGTCVSISMETHGNDYGLYSGLPLLAIGVLSSAAGISHISASPLLLSISILFAIAALSWSPTQPRALATALSIAWPLVMTLAGFLSLNVTHSISTFQALSFAALYIGLYRLVQTSAIANSAQSAANIIPKSSGSEHFGGYYINEILKDKESRDIFYFLCLNLSFMVVQMLYGIWTNSLGLISDSIHMFFDCLALAVGLVAAVMSKWPASRSHPFGFAKVEIISGFANGIFLVLISISIMIEAAERLLEPPEMKTDQLLLVSTLGLGVNLVGIFAFNHGHHHGHSHGHSHGHDHDHAHEHKKSPEPLPTIHTPKSARPDNTYDHLQGLKSPFPDFSNFAGFDPSPRGSVAGLGLEDSIPALRENSLNLPTNASRSRSPNRSRSPIRRPGSPLKVAIEPSLPDLTENIALVTKTENVPPHLAHDHAHDHAHSHGHNHDHDHHHVDEFKDKDNTSDKHVHRHYKKDSYDLTAGSTPACGHSHAVSDHAHAHHAHGHNHDHSHNMEGIFLHILADTLGSAGVIVSTLLIRTFHWTGFDPLASIFIACLIFLSVLPLLRSSFKDLLLTLQDDREYTLREVLGEVSLIAGVSAIPFIRFWVDGGGRTHGILTIRAGIDGDLETVRGKVKRKLEEGVPDVDVVVQVDR